MDSKLADKIIRFNIIRLLFL